MILDFNKFKENYVYRIIRDGKPGEENFDVYSLCNGFSENSFWGKSLNFNDIYVIKDKLVKDWEFSEKNFITTGYEFHEICDAKEYEEKYPEHFI